MMGTGTVHIDYTNHRGERAWRSILPRSISYATSEWHEGYQWLLLAFDYDKQADRQFEMASIHEWKTP